MEWWSHVGAQLFAREQQHLLLTARLDTLK